MIEAVKKVRGLVIKLPARWYKGIPDRMILLSEGRIFFIELKKSGEALSKAQGPWIRLLRRLGFQAMKIEGEEELKKFIFWNIT